MTHLNELVSKRQALAREFARIAHDDMGQRRKGSNDPYWKHPQTVADLLESYGASEPALCAAELHDTVEDTEVDYEHILEYYGKDVADLVKEVTNSPDLDGMEKEDYMNFKILKLSNDALTIKLGDMLHNCLDKPKLKQIERMKRNLEFLLRKRKNLLEVHRELIDTFMVGFKFKRKELRP